MLNIIRARNVHYRCYFSHNACVYEGKWEKIMRRRQFDTDNQYRARNVIPLVYNATRRMTIGIKRNLRSRSPDERELTTFFNLVKKKMRYTRLI